MTAGAGPSDDGSRPRYPAAMRGPRSIPNEGSTARDHLAGERTFLAWVRTGLGIVGLGVVTGKFVEAEGNVAEVIGLALVVLGALMLGYAVLRFQQVARGLDEGVFRPAFWGPIVVALASISVSVGALVILLR